MKITVQVLTEREKTIGGRLFREILCLELPGDDRFVKVFSYSLREGEAQYWNKLNGKTIELGITGLPSLYNGEPSFSGRIISVVGAK